MFRKLLVLTAAAAMATSAWAAATTQPATQPAATQPGANTPHQEGKTVPSVLSYKMKSLSGKEVDLSKYRGKVVMMVNVASKCGLTPQYKQLEEVYGKYKDKGLVILGFPANNFGAQEPGTDQDIQQFCSMNYGVDFDMFSKISVKGDDKAPLYKTLTEKEAGAKFPGDITWNFEKFLVGRSGEVVNRFPPKTTPDSPEVIKAIEAELAKKA